MELGSVNPQKFGGNMFGKFLTDGEKVLDNWREVPKNYLEIPAFL